MNEASPECPAEESDARDRRGGAGGEAADGQALVPNSTAALQIDPYVDPHVRLTSVTTSIRDYVYENGRRYHAYREGEYLIPNDEKEQDRLDLIHHVFRLMLGGALYRAPIPPTVKRVLDMGTGTGIWAIDFGL